jgi:hypothetical protein
LTSSAKERSTRIIVSLVLSSFLLVFLVYVFVFGPDALPIFKQRILAIVCALAVALLSVLLTGTLGLVLDPIHSKVKWFRIQATSGFAGLVLVLFWWFSPWTPVAPVKFDAPDVTIYRVRVVILDPQQMPVNTAQLRSSLGGEIKEVGGGYELDIPSANKPANGKLTVYASNENGSLRGQSELKLDTDPNPSITIQLHQSLSTSETGNASATQQSKSGSSESSFVATVESGYPSLYRVRVTALDPQNIPVEDAEIRSSIGGEFKKATGGWELSIPKTIKPKNSNLTIYVFDRGRFLVGQASLKLGVDPNPTISIQMRTDQTSRVYGRIVEDDSLRASISGVRVSLEGFEQEAVISGANGEFKLPAHAAEGQMVRLRAEKEGYVTREQFHPAGNVHVVILLRKK